MDKDDEPMLRRWLLHQLPEDQTRALEQRLLEDDAFGAHLRAVESDLLDDFARARLAPADQAAVALHLLATPADRERLRFAVALARTSQSASAAPVPETRLAHTTQAWTARLRFRRRTVAWAGLAAACAAALVVAVTLHRGSGESGALAQATATIALADPRRGAAITEVRLPRDTDKIRLQAEVDSDAANARYALTVADGPRTLVSASNLVPHRAGPYRYVEVVMTAGVLGHGERRVSLVEQGNTEAPAAWSINVGTAGGRPGTPTGH